MRNNDVFYLKMGYDAAHFLGEYYAEGVVNFITGKPTEKGEIDGSMYYYKLKPYYDKYGFDSFNLALTILYKQKKEQTNEQSSIDW